MSVLDNRCTACGELALNLHLAKWNPQTGGLTSYCIRDKKHTFAIYSSGETASHETLVLQSLGFEVYHNE